MKEKALNYDQLREILSPVHPSVLFDMAYDLLMDDPEQDDLHDFDEVELLDLVASEAADRGWSETEANEVIEDYGGDHYGRTREAKRNGDSSALFEKVIRETAEDDDYDEFGLPDPGQEKDWFRVDDTYAEPPAYAQPDRDKRTREAKGKKDYSALFERALKEADENIEYDPGIDSYVREVGRLVSEASKHTTMNAKKAADQIASAFLFGCYSGSRGLSPTDARKLFERMKRGEQHVSLQ